MVKGRRRSPGGLAYLAVPSATRLDAGVSQPGTQEPRPNSAQALRKGSGGWPSRSAGPAGDISRAIRSISADSMMVSSTGSPPLSATSGPWVMGGPCCVSLGGRTGRSSPSQGSTTRSRPWRASRPLAVAPGTPQGTRPRVRILWYTPDSLEYSGCQNLGKSGRCFV